MTDDANAVTPTAAGTQRDDVHDHRPPVGAVPGALYEDAGAHPTTIRVMDYGPDQLTEKKLDSLDELRELIESDTVTWIDVAGFRDLKLLQELAEMLSLHRLALADAVNVPQRAKTEVYPEYVFMVSHIPYLAKSELHTEQVSVVVWDRFVLSFQERPLDDSFELLRERIRKSLGVIRTKHTGYLGFAIIDLVTDSNFPLLDKIDGDLANLEDRILKGDTEILTPLYELKHQCMDMRRTVNMHRDALNTLLHVKAEFFGDDVKPFLRDCFDHALNQSNTAMSLQEFASSLRELHTSEQAQRMNEVMKVLTIVATIFIPLSFFAGVYGMNWDTNQPGNLPELSVPYGYVFFWLFMILTAGGMLLFFKKKKWL